MLFNDNEAVEKVSSAHDAETVQKDVAAARSFEQFLFHSCACHTGYR
ncbi:MAG: hypothetical protein NUV63_10700 [Gallionella sp.]|nr:hypothetical protein [Gallionella sp.]